MPNPKRRHSKTRTAKRRTHDALEAGARRRVPTVPGIEGPSPGLPALRLLQGPPGPRRPRGMNRLQESQSRFGTRCAIERHLTTCD